MKNLSGQMRRSLPHFAGWKPAGVHGLRSGAGGSFPPRGAARPKSERFYPEETAPGGMDIRQVSF